MRMGKFIDLVKEISKVKTAIKAVDSEALGTPSAAIGSEAWLVTFKQIWAPVSAVLDLVKSFIPQKGDVVVDEVKSVGDLIADGKADANTQFLPLFKTYWPEVKFVLALIKVFGNDKVDTIIDQVVAHVEFFLGEEA